MCCVVCVCGSWGRQLKAFVAEAKAHLSTLTVGVADQLALLDVVEQVFNGNPDATPKSARESKPVTPPPPKPTPAAALPPAPPAAATSPSSGDGGDLLDQVVQHYRSQFESSGMSGAVRASCCGVPQLCVHRVSCAGAGVGCDGCRCWTLPWRTFAKAWLPCLKRYWLRHLRRFKSSRRRRAITEPTAAAFFPTHTAGSVSWAHLCPVAPAEPPLAWLLRC